MGDMVVDQLNGRSVAEEVTQILTDALLFARLRGTGVGDDIHIPDTEAGYAQAGRNAPDGCHAQRRLYADEALLLAGCDDLSVSNDRGTTVVFSRKGRAVQSENNHWQFVIISREATRGPGLIVSARARRAVLRIQRTCMKSVCLPIRIGNLDEGRSPE